MNRRTLLPALFGICLSGLFLFFLPSVIFAQQAKITIQCASDPETKIKKEEPDGAKPKIKKSDAKSLRLKLDEPSEKSVAVAANLADEASIIPIGCEGLAVITVYTGPPNSTVNFTVTQSNSAGIVELKRFSQDAYAPSIVLPIALDGNSYGASAPFYVRGKTLGETAIIGTSSFADTNPLNILVVECKCPVIPVNTPPRN